MNQLQKNQMDFINLRLGTFIHFNSATSQFYNSDVIDWEFEHENNDEPRRYPFSPSQWNPYKLDCAQWAKAAKSAGCKFAALTVKHHEGFCLWPTKYSEHCVRNAACTTDVAAEYLKAFRQEGIQAGFYFSILDLTANIGKKSCNENQKEIIKGQITELLTNYGEIPFLIVDGWNAPWGGPSYEMLSFEELDSLIKSIQPNCLFMNIGCTDTLKQTDIVFYENAAGQDVEGEFHGPGVSCNKFTKTWFWKETAAEEQLSPTEDTIQKMEKYFPMNINFMLNLSPNIFGTIDDNLMEAFKKVGEKAEFPKPLEALPQGWLVRK